MGAEHARTVARSRWRAYLLLSRCSNLPTVWTNILAGAIASGAPIVAVDLVQLALAGSCFYTGGMFLNDAFDRGHDARYRPDRPIPARDVPAAEVFAIGFGLLALGEAWLMRSRFAAAVPWGVALAVAIVGYDAWHKRNPFGPVVMGACRGLLYCVAAAATGGSIGRMVVAGAVAVGLWVVFVTMVAKYGDRRYGWSISWLLAAISVVDAVVIVIAGGGAWAALGLAGFAATVVLQRIVPGT